jgi:hypothetical protein
MYSPPSSSRRFAGEDGLARTLKSLFHGGMVCSLPRARGRVRVGAFSRTPLIIYEDVQKPSSPYPSRNASFSVTGSLPDG